MAILEGFAIIPPVSPWDEKHRDEIQLDAAKGTIGKTPAEAWGRHVQRGIDNIDSAEFSRRVQFWFDRGYRVCDVRLEIVRDEGR